MSGGGVDGGRDARGGARGAFAPRARSRRIIILCIKHTSVSFDRGESDRSSVPSASVQRRCHRNFMTRRSEQSNDGRRGRGLARASVHIEVPSGGRLADPVAWCSTAFGEVVESAIATMRPAGVDASGTRGGARGAAVDAWRARPGAVALGILSSLALFVAATFQAASQRPSVVVRSSPPSTPSPRARRSHRAAAPTPPPPS